MPKQKCDFPNKSFGEIIQEFEKKGAFGNFSHIPNNQSDSMITSRQFWISAGVDQLLVFEEYLGNSAQKIENIENAINYIEPILSQLATELMAKIKSNNDKPLNKLLQIYKKVYDYYLSDRKARTKIAKLNSDYTNPVLEANRNIALTLFDGLDILIENHIALQNIEEKDAYETFGQVKNDDLFDSDLLIKTYLYALLSRYTTILNICKKTNKNYTYCSGIIVNPDRQIPIEGIRYHPKVFTSVLLAGNQNVLAQKKDFFSNLNETPLGQGFQKSYGFGLLEVIKIFNFLEKKYNSNYVTTMSINELAKNIEKKFKHINGRQFIEHFSIRHENLKKYISDDQYIYKIGQNKYRLAIRPIIIPNNEIAYLSPAAISKSMNLWYSYAINGGRPYTEIDVGKGDLIIDGFGERESELSNKLVELVLQKLRHHFPNPDYSKNNVNYYQIFGKKPGFQDTSDYDIVYFANNELYLIEVKYFSDSFTATQTIGDFNKMFVKEKYYEHCRKRFVLVEAEPEKMKAFINANNQIQVHYLFVSSKPLEIDFHDKDKLITFLCLANFDKYLNGTIEPEDGEILRSIRKI